MTRPNGFWRAWGQWIALGLAIALALLLLMAVGLYAIPRPLPPVDAPGFLAYSATQSGICNRKT